MSIQYKHIYVIKLPGIQNVFIHTWMVLRKSRLGVRVNN